MTSRLKSPAFIICLAILFGSGIVLPAAVKALGWFLVKRPIETDLKLTSIASESEHFKQFTVDRAVDASVQETLGTFNYLTRGYFDKPEKDAASAKDASKVRALEVHAAYYTGTIDTVPHVPDRCLVGAGFTITGGPWIVRVPLDASPWNVDDAATTDIRAAGYGGTSIYAARYSPLDPGRAGLKLPAPGVRIRLPRGVENLEMRISEYSKPGSERKLFAGYFFIANGGLTPTSQGVRELAFDLRSDYAYYLKVQFSSESVASADDLARLAADWLNDYLPDLMLCAPDWVEVMRGNYPADNPRRKHGGAPSPASRADRTNIRNHGPAIARPAPEGLSWHLA